MTHPLTFAVRLGGRKVLLTSDHLQFGWSWAPFCAQRVSLDVCVSALRSIPGGVWARVGPGAFFVRSESGVACVFVWYDDFLVCSPSRALCLSLGAAVRTALASRGLHPSPKTPHVVLRDCVWTGLRFDPSGLAGTSATALPLAARVLVSSPEPDAGRRAMGLLAWASRLMPEARTLLPLWPSAPLAVLVFAQLVLSRSHPPPHVVERQFVLPSDVYRTPDFPRSYSGCMSFVVWLREFVSSDDVVDLWVDSTPQRSGVILVLRSRLAVSVAFTATTSPDMVLGVVPPRVCDQYHAELSGVAVSSFLSCVLAAAGSVSRHPPLVCGDSPALVRPRRRKGALLFARSLVSVVACGARVFRLFPFWVPGLVHPADGVSRGVRLSACSFIRLVSTAVRLRPVSLARIPLPFATFVSGGPQAWRTPLSLVSGCAAPIR